MRSLKACKLCWPRGIDPYQSPNNPNIEELYLDNVLLESSNRVPPRPPNRLHLPGLRDLTIKSESTYVPIELLSPLAFPTSTRVRLFFESCPPLTDRHIDYCPSLQNHVSSIEVLSLTLRCIWYTPVGIVTLQSSGPNSFRARWTHDSLRTTLQETAFAILSF
ncbi:hypothetical protein WOLCODRAFT_138828, partial [Wolfiporia cocos MD-104 SS10]